MANSWIVTVMSGYSSVGKLAVNAGSRIAARTRLEQLPDFLTLVSKHDVKTLNIIITKPTNLLERLREGLL